MDVPGRSQIPGIARGFNELTSTVTMNLSNLKWFDSSVNNSEIPNRVFHLIRSTVVAHLSSAICDCDQRTHQKLQN